MNKNYLYLGLAALAILLLKGKSEKEEEETSEVSLDDLEKETLEFKPNDPNVTL